jgi:hypothetical protein
MERKYSIIKSMLLSYDNDYKDPVNHANHLEQIINESQLMKQLKDVDYYMCDEDKLLQYVVQYSKLIDEQPLQLLNVYRYRLIQTQDSLLAVLRLINQELMDCNSIDSELNDIVEDHFTIDVNMLHNIRRMVQ